MQTTELEVRAPERSVYIPTPQDWQAMVAWGRDAIRSGMLPSSIRNPEAAAIIILKGRELGLPFMTAVSHIHVINGKPTMSAELINSLARRNLPGLVINILKSDDSECEIEFIRPEKNAKPFVQRFTRADAEKAKLANKDVWKSFPAAMLFSRAMTAGLRKVCPEALMGISYTPEELGAEVDGEGNVIEVVGKPVGGDGGTAEFRKSGDMEASVGVSPRVEASYNPNFDSGTTPEGGLKKPEYIFPKGQHAGKTPKDLADATLEQYYKEMLDVPKANPEHGKHPSYVKLMEALITELADRHLGGF